MSFLGMHITISAGLLSGAYALVPDPPNKVGALFAIGLVQGMVLPLSLWRLKKLSKWRNTAYLHWVVSVTHIIVSALLVTRIVKDSSADLHSIIPLVVALFPSSLLVFPILGSALGSVSIAFSKPPISILFFGAVGLALGLLHIWAVAKYFADDHA